jgi:hypothetical protein
MAASMSLALAQTGGSSGGTGGAGAAGTGGGATTGSMVPSGTRPTPAPTPGQSTTLPSTIGRPGGGQPSGSALDTTGVAGSRPGCKPTTSGSAEAMAEVRAPRIANDPALGSGTSAELNVGGTKSADTGVGGSTSLPRSSSGKNNDC